MKVAYIIFSAFCQWFFFAFWTLLLWLQHSPEELGSVANKFLAGDVIFSAGLVTIIHLITFRTRGGKGVKNN